MEHEAWRVLVLSLAGMVACLTGLVLYLSGACDRAVDGWLRDNARLRLALEREELLCDALRSDAPEVWRTVLPRIVGMYGDDQPPEPEAVNEAA